MEYEYVRTGRKRRLSKTAARVLTRAGLVRAVVPELEEQPPPVMLIEDEQTAVDDAAKPVRKRGKKDGD